MNEDKRRVSLTMSEWGMLCSVMRTLTWGNGSIHLWSDLEESVNERMKEEDAIPSGVYYNENHDNFYTQYRIGMGTPFYEKWRTRCSEFPTCLPRGT